MWTCLITLTSDAALRAAHDPFSKLKQARTWEEEAMTTISVEGLTGKAQIVECTAQVLGDPKLLIQQ